jgi:tartrate dehydrogenase/decarboxylase/D-malate dehydrogenase
MKIFQIASLPGDGIGRETVSAGRQVLETLCEVQGGLRLEYIYLDWSC